MAGFYWLPFPDKGWHADTLARGDRRYDKMLPFLDGTDASRSASGVSLPAGAWSEIKEGDELWLPVHGHKYSTEIASWSVEGKLISWTAPQFAEKLLEKLLWKGAYSLHYHLLACFGANNISLFAKSFGERLANAMTALNFQGTLTAYKGATGLAANRGHQIGTSRLTAAPIFLMHRGPGAPSATTLATQDAAKSWRLGVRGK
jgi:hypothetical protein